MTATTSDVIMLDVMICYVVSWLVGKADIEITYTANDALMLDVMILLRGLVGRGEA